MTHASLFSGIGGPEVAATMLGWDNLFHCEINEFGRKILDYWFPNSKSYEDITKTDFSEWRGKVDIFTGGFPCQPFSYAGKRRGADDDRYLWPYMFKAIDQIRPTWIVAENVAGITTMVEQGEVSEVGGQASMFEEVDDIHRYRYSATFTLERICRDLESHGYQVQPVLVPACAVGAPHRRDRLFIVARRVEAVSEDPMHSRQLYGQDEVEGSERNERNTCAGGGERICGGTSRTTSADTSSQGREKRMRSGQQANRTKEGAGMDNRTERPCDNGDAANTESKQSNGHGFVGESGKEEKGQFRRGCVKSCGLGERWDSFPSVSPVHRGNDGIPFDVDRLSIPFSKWRTESIKAYGNAIVPQVMYEIFRAIEITEKGAAPSTRQ